MRRRQLHRLWQLLLKGFDEVRTAPDPLVAAQMALLRVMHAADMPDPGQLAKRLEELASRPAVAASAPDGSPAPAASAVVLPWEALVGKVKQGQIGLATKMEMQVRVVELTAGRLRWSQPSGFTEDFSREMKAGLDQATDQSWIVERCADAGQPTLVEQNDAASAASEAAVRQSPLVEAVFAAFPEAQLITEEEEAAQFRGSRNWSQRR